MGFINIDGNLIHTSAIGLTFASSGTYITNSSSGISISGTTSTTSIGAINISGAHYISNSQSWKPLQAEYNLMGESISIDGYQDPHIAHLISSINILGWKYYEEFKKQNINITGDILTFLENGYKSYQRDRKINDIIEY